MLKHCKTIRSEYPYCATLNANLSDAGISISTSRKVFLAIGT